MKGLVTMTPRPSETDRPRRATALAHDSIREHLKLGDVVVDATLGNGHDALFLAKLVGETGRVIGFDVQEAAIRASRDRLTEAGVIDRIHLVHAGHETMAEHLESPVAAVMFNLGYLPGADHELITRHETTLKALGATLESLEQGGLITCVCYPGHPGGLEEAEAVMNWALGTGMQVIIKNEEGRHEGRPFLVAVKKISEK